MKLGRVVMIVSAVLTAVIAIAYHFLGGHEAPATQEALSDLNTQSLEAFKLKFNKASDRLRIILLLSPT